MSDMSVYGRFQKGYYFEKCRCCHSARGSDVKRCKERQPPQASPFLSVLQTPPASPFLSILQTCTELHTIIGQGSKILAFIAVLLACSSVFNQK